MFGTLRRVVRHYAGRVAAWSVVNEVTSREGIRGLRTDVPWYETIGPSYVARAFHLAHEADPEALLMLNEFGFETVNRYGDRPAGRQRATLQARSVAACRRTGARSRDPGPPLARDFALRFHENTYRAFLGEVAGRGLRILITELDVLDSGLPARPSSRDAAVADVYRRYLHTALAEPAVAAVLTFGLSDRYTWLEEDYPRRDGAHRRPLPFDRGLRPKPAYAAIAETLRRADARSPLWGRASG